MISDEERREVARRLRYDAKGGALPYSDFLGAVAYDVGAEKEHAAVLNRIADLIEPDTTSDTAKQGADTTECDRAALLELADEIDRSAIELLKTALLAMANKMQSQQYMREDARSLRWDEASRRIPEALGIDDGR